MPDHLSGAEYLDKRMADSKRERERERERERAEEVERFTKMMDEVEARVVAAGGKPGYRNAAAFEARRYENLASYWRAIAANGGKLPPEREDPRRR
jgi:hypothetical protein